MGQAYDKFPKVDVGTHQPEQIWRDWEMFNIHINAHKQRWLKDIVDIMDCHRFDDDFCSLPDTSFDFNLEESPRGSGVITPACVDMVNGVLDLRTHGDDGDNAELTQMCECWQFVNCYPLYGEIRFYLSDVIDTDFWFGYVQGHTWFGVAPNDYAVFHKDDTNALLDFSNAVGGVVTNTNGIATLVQCTWYRLGIHWDGAGTIRYFLIQDGNFPQTILATGAITTNIPTQVMSFGFGIQAGSAEVKDLYVDYVKSCQLRVI
ncbi:MAG: hypothetical protein KAV87_06140 [Desulfobacteraceae bacterium]|nr:hypothetical protein [Desulfobacteraceae bacterium]